jgi:hypothetical protein
VKTETLVSDMISCGQLSVVQGSKRLERLDQRPLLFILFINEIASLPLKGKLYLFADDITLLVEAENYEELRNVINSNLQLIKNWLNSNKLIPNENKLQVYDNGWTTF